MIVDHCQDRMQPDSRSEENEGRREGKMSGESWEWEGRVKEAVEAERGKVLGGLPALLPPLPGEEEVCETRLGPPRARDIRPDRCSFLRAGRVVY